MHGGTNKGPPKGSNNATTHGIYTQGIKDSEKDLWTQVQVDSVDDEIKLMSIQLARAAKCQKEFEEEIERVGVDEGEKGLELSEEESKTGTGSQGPFTSKKVVRKRPDYRKIIFNLSGRIGKLKAIRASIMTGGQDDDIDWTEVGFRAAVAANVSTDRPANTDSPPG